MTDPNKANEPQDSDDFEADWAAAMAEQQAGEAAEKAAETETSESSESRSGTQAEGLSDLDDDWAAALAEQTAGSIDDSADTTASETAEEPAVAQPQATADTSLFKPFDEGKDGSTSDIDMIMDIPVQLSVELGRTRLTLKNILQLGQGSVVELDGLAGEPMDIYVNGYLIAQGEVVVVEEKYGIRITDIVTPSDRIQRLNSRR